jgi:hypothetical protein
VRRSRALAAVSAVERRLKAQASAAQALALEAAGLRHRNRADYSRNLCLFGEGAARSAFVCAASASHRTGLAIEAARLAVHQRTVDDAAHAAADAVIPWAQIRCGLERRIARRAAGAAS